jgi:hypothetical protein
MVAVIGVGLLQIRVKARVEAMAQRQFGSDGCESVARRRSPCLPWQRPKTVEGPVALSATGAELLAIAAIEPWTSDPFEGSFR